MIVKPARSAVHSFGQISKAHASIPIPESKLILVTSGRDSTVRLIDPRSKTEKARVAVGADPEAAFYDAHIRREVVDAAKERVIKLLPICKGPNAVILDAVRRLAFVPAARTARWRRSRSMHRAVRR